MEIILEPLLQLMSYMIGAPVLRCLSGGRIKVSKEERNAIWGFSKSADGSILIEPELAGLFGLVLLVLAIVVFFWFQSLKR